MRLRYSVKSMSVEMLLGVSLLFVIIGITSCSKNDVNPTGMSLLGTEDEIKVGTDTFPLPSYMVGVDSIPSDPDSLLLGEADTKLGTIHAEVLTQFACPEGFHFPDNAVLDSAFLILYYSSWYGDGNSAMSIDVFQMDKKSMNYDEIYFTDINPDDYCSFADSTRVAKNPIVLTARTPTDSTYLSSTGGYLKYIKVPLTEDFMEVLRNNGNYESSSKFLENFKGLYIKSVFGSSTILYINSLAMSLHYHFTYQIEGKDTITKDVVDFYANDEVRTVNRINHIDRLDIIDIVTNDEEISYIESPAHIYTVLQVPLSNITTSIKDSMLQGKRPYTNSAKIKVYATNYVSKVDQTKPEQWSQPPKYMLLIEKDHVEKFFTSRSLPNDTTAILSSLYTEQNEDLTTSAYYSYDISTLLTKALREEKTDSTLELFMIPVAINSIYSSTYGTSTITSVRPLQVISSTQINTKENKSNPLRISVVATGL